MPQPDTRIGPKVQFDVSNQPCTYGDKTLVRGERITDGMRKPQRSKKNPPEIRKAVDAQDGQVLLRVIVIRDLIDIMIPPAGGQK